MLYLRAECAREALAGLDLGRKLVTNEEGERRDAHTDCDSRFVNGQ